MSIFVGLDIGAVSLKLAVLEAPGSERLPAAVKARPDLFSCNHFPPSSPFEDHGLLLSHYRRIHGSPVQAAQQLLAELQSVLPAKSIAGIRTTGSGSKLLAGQLKHSCENEFRAIVKGVRLFCPQVRTIFEIGGESSKYVLLSPAPGLGHLGIADYQMSGDCAAGTGSFIDQQASRLLYEVEEVGRVACEASCAARIAGRCSVFAKSDMIHAQQKGYSTDQILAGLCQAVARNFKSGIVKGHPVEPPVAFIGGVALNQGIVLALRELFKLQETEWVLPELHSWMGAVGAALLEAECKVQGSRSLLNQWTHPPERPMPPEDNPPLSMEKVVLLRDSVPPPTPMPTGTPVEAYLGIDIGSVSTNLVVIDREGTVLKDIYLRTQGRPIEVVDQGLEEIAEELGPWLSIRGVGTTGSGRELIGELVGADTVNDEITAHKTGALHICQELGLASVDTIFEIGGQDSKFIRLENGVVVDFTMNEACAAGTGSFLEEQAEKLGISIKKEFARLALASPRPVPLGERCTVFMERDVTTHLLKGDNVRDLAAGLANSVALNYLNRVVRGRKIGDVIFFQGGTAYNDAVAAAFAGALGKTIIVPPHNGVIGAIGMALIARDRMQNGNHPSRFRGFSLNHTLYTVREFACQACSNHCDIKEFTVEGQRSYWGDKCSDKFRKRARTDRQPVIEDLLSLRDTLLLKELQPSKESRPTIGIPRTMFFFDQFPFWCTYFQELGFNVELSSPTDRKIAAWGEEIAVAEPCFPVIVAHGHVGQLIEQGVDYILLPNNVNAETSQPRTNSYFCPWNQTLPFVLRAAPHLEGAKGKFLVPTVHFRLGVGYVQESLAEMAAKLNISRRRSHRAVLAGYAAQKAFSLALVRAGEKALCRLAEAEEQALLLVGRSYNLYDRSINCDIPRKLSTFYGANLLPLDFLPLEEEDISWLHPNMYWNSGRRILAAGLITRRNANLHPVYVSNFKCGPDSFIKSFLSDAAQKPALVLQFDGHSNDAGYLTRCEAYLDSKGLMQCSQRTVAA